MYLQGMLTNSTVSCSRAGDLPLAREGGGTRGNVCIRSPSSSARGTGERKVIAGACRGKTSVVTGQYPVWPGVHAQIVAAVVVP